MIDLLMDARSMADAVQVGFGGNPRLGGGPVMIPSMYRGFWFLVDRAGRFPPDFEFPASSFGGGAGCLLFEVPSYAAGSVKCLLLSAPDVFFDRSDFELSEGTVLGFSSSGTVRAGGAAFLGLPLVGISASWASSLNLAGLALDQ